MTLRAKIETLRRLSRPPFEQMALLLQGGGALGAYQAGVYEALAEADLHPDWAAGISIGAINSGLIAGNPPEKRVAKLREFWESITVPPWGLAGRLENILPKNEAVREFMSQFSAGLVLLTGAAKFFVPRFPSPWLHQAGTLEATSYYDTTTLRTTLERLIDFDRINAGDMRLSVGAVNVRTGNFQYFDTTTHTIGPEHVMASGALPPGFPAVEIDGEWYWDGGLVSNTPLQWVVDSEPSRDTLAFQVDLWSARGEFPRDLADVETRRKEIQFSSRTRASTDTFRRIRKMRRAAMGMLEKLPAELRTSTEAEFLRSVGCNKVYNIIHLIYRAKDFEGQSKDFEFSRSSMEEHWRAGYSDAVQTLRHPEVLERPRNPEGVFTFDLARDGRE